MKTYFILDESTQRVKIGRSVDPQERLKTLQTGAPCKLILLGVVEGDREKELQNDLIAHRLRGEWFAWNEAVRCKIRTFGMKGLPRVKGLQVKDDETESDFIYVAESIVRCVPSTEKIAAADVCSWLEEELRSDIEESLLNADLVELSQFFECSEFEDSLEWIEGVMEQDDGYCPMIDDDFIENLLLCHVCTKTDDGCLLVGLFFQNPRTAAAGRKLKEQLVQVAEWADQLTSTVFVGGIWESKSASYDFISYDIPVPGEEGEGVRQMLIE